jgi:DNA repair exonuclease SbcCD nuclease subunit
MVHGALAIPGRTDSDEVVFTQEEIAATGLDYLALGHWHSALEGRAGGVTYAYSGAPEPVALDQVGAGQALLVTLEERGGQRVVTVEPRRVGRTTVEKLELDAGSLRTQPEMIDSLARRADPDLVLDVRLTGLFPDDLDLDTDEVERALAPSFLRFRLRDESIPAAPEGLAAPPDTVVGAFVRNVQARIAELEAAAGTGAVAGTAATGAGSVTPAEQLAEMREVLRLGRHLLEGREVTL